MPRLFFPLCVLVLFITMNGLATAGPSSERDARCNCNTKGYHFGRAYYIEDGGLVVVPWDHGFHYHRGVETPEGVKFRPGESFVQFDGSRHVEQDYWLVKVNWFNNRAILHEQVYHYKVVKDDNGGFHTVRGRLLATNDFTLTHFRGLVAFDHAYSSIEMQPGTRLWRRQQWPLRAF